MPEPEKLIDDSLRGRLRTLGEAELIDKSAVITLRFCAAYAAIWSATKVGAMFAQFADEIEKG